MGVAAADGGGASSSSTWSRVAVEGCSSTGATMSVAQCKQPAASAGGRRCCGGECINVNIYVNTNVQGVTNSVLLGSKVVMRDPGARVSSRCRRAPRWRRGERRGKQELERSKTVLKKAGVIFLVAAAAAVLCFVLLIHVRRLN